MPRITRILPLVAFGLTAAATTGVALAQNFNLDLSQGGGSMTARLIQLLAVLTVLSLAPSIVITVTSFTRIVIVLSFLRTAIGVPQSPPNSILVSLAIFLTAFIMAPTLERVYSESFVPLVNEQISEGEALNRAIEPVKTFMLRHAREQDLALFTNIARLDPAPPAAQTPIHVVIPAFMISELRRAFEIGFLLFIPFLIIDIVVAAVLTSMGVVLLPPASISLPFKIIFFVLVDGWYLIIGSLVQSFGVG